MGNIANKTKEDLKLSKNLENWFNNNRQNHHKWRRNPVGRLIKKEMEKEDRWKVARRGNPKKGFAKQRESLAGNCEYL